jgi:hypothetical protein
MLELTVLHVLHERQVEFWYVVLIHVEQDVPNHHDALLDFLPDAVKLFQELLVVVLLDVLSNGLEQLHSSVLDAVVEHLTVLVEDEAVRSAV